MAQRSFRAVAGRSPPLNRPTDRIAHLWRQSGTAVDRFCWPNSEEADPLARSAAVTDLPLAGFHLDQCSGSTAVYRSVQFDSPSLKRRVRAGCASQVTVPTTEQPLERPVLP